VPFSLERVVTEEALKLDAAIGANGALELRASPLYQELMTPSVGEDQRVHARPRRAPAFESATRLKCSGSRRRKVAAAEPGASLVREAQAGGGEAAAPELPGRRLGSPGIRLLAQA
jgi:hypothetical protein